MTPPARCPAGSVADVDDQCRQPVADAPGAFTCPQDGILNGRACVYTTGFLVDPDKAQYRCPSGDRSLVSTGDQLTVICLLGEPVVGERVGCIQGVLTGDGTLCEIPVIRQSTAPLPAFTG